MQRVLCKITSEVPGIIQGRITFSLVPCFQNLGNFPRRTKLFRVCSGLERGPGSAHWPPASGNRKTRSFSRDVRARGEHGAVSSPLEAELLEWLL